MTPTVAVLFARADSVTVNRLRELFAYDPDTGIVARRIAFSNAKAGDRVGTPNADGYLVASVDRQLHYVHRIAWALHTGAWPTFEVDHRDASPANNRWTNLRDVKHAINTQNRRRADRDSSTHLLGAFKAGAKFSSKIRCAGTLHYLGTFETAKAAHAAYVAAKRRLHEGCTL